MRRQSYLPIILIACACHGAIVSGQIAFDGSIVPAGQVLPSGNTFRINATVDGVSGSNLFHSFSEFSIPSGMVADFESPAAIHRIIARVTGGGVSEIDGLLKTSGSNADFFLINPRGISFGADARIDVGGAFTASTAEVLIDLDGVKHSMLAGGAVLFSAPVEAFGFLAAVAGGNVAVNGARLQNPGGDIQLIGRNVSFSQADISAGGDLNVRAVGEGGAMVPLDFHGEASGGDAGRLTVDGSLLRSGGGNHRIALFGNEVDISSSRLNVDAFNLFSDGGIRIGAGARLDVTDGSELGIAQVTGSGGTLIDIRSMGRIVLDDSLIVSLNGSSGPGANIRVEAENLLVEGNGNRNPDLKGILSVAGANATGGAVDVIVSAGIGITNNALLGSLTSDYATGGGVVVRAGEIAITGPSLDNAAAEFLTGIIGISYDSSQGGDLDVEAGAISLHRGGLIDSSSFGTGDGGDIVVRAGKILVDRAGSPFLTGIGSDTEIDGAGGSVAIFADDITLLGGGLISSSTSGAGNAGSLRVEVERFSAIGSGADSPFVAATHSGLAAVTANKGEIPSGNGGNIVMLAGSVRLDDRAGISTISEETGRGSAGLIEVTASDVEMTVGSVISSAALGAGEAGGVVLTAGRVRMTDSIMEVSAAANNAGSVSVISSGDLVLSNSLLSATAGGVGRGGDVVLSGRNVTVTGNAAGILASTLQGSSGRGGNVRIAAEDGLLIDGARAAAESLGSGGAGSLTLDAGSWISVVNGGEVSARALGAGAGGSVGVFVSGGRLAVANGGRISSSSDVAGDAGQVRLDASMFDLSGGGVIESLSTGMGRAGGIDGRFNQMNVVNGAIRVASEMTDAGSVDLRAGGLMGIAGGLVSATAGGVGKGGDVRLTAGEMHLSDGTRVEAVTTGSGEAGRIDLTASSLDLTGGAVVSSAATGTGNAGEMTLRGGHVSMNEGASLSVLAVQGDAGSLRVLSDGDLRGDRVSISANAGNDGGNIEFRAGGLIFLNHSEVTADAGGSGGNISFTGARHLVLNDTPVSASAVARDGGNIFVSTGTFFANNSPLSVTSERGAPGTIRIETLDVLDGGIEQEEPELLDPNDVLQPSCSERAPDVGSSFTRAGKGATPRLPGGYVPSFRILE